MNRRAVVAILCSASLVGCARGRSVMPGVGPIDPMAASQSYAPIGETINAGYSPTDPGLQRVAYPPPEGATTATPRATPSPKAPAPFAVPAPASVVPRPIPDAPAPIDLPEPPPAAAVPAPAPPADPPSAGPAGAGGLSDLPIPDTPPASALAPSARSDEATLPPLPASAYPASRLVPTAQVVKPASDPLVKPVVSNSDPTRVRATVSKRSGLRRDLPVTMIAATIGTEEITYSELDRAVKEHLQGAPSSRVSKEDKDRLAQMTLDDLIQRAMLIQAAKRKLKDEKNWGKMLNHFDTVWVEHELPQQIQKNRVADEHELEQLLKKRGQSLKTMREDFKNKTAAIEFLRAEILPKVRIDLPIMRAYYEAHLHDFDHGALIRWREVEVKVSRHKDRAEALQKAEAALARLRKGEAFEAVARSVSEGTNAKDGGSWETTPDSVGIPAINDAVNTMPVQQISPILEGPDGYHIVLVEARLAAGPASFSEVQDKIASTLREEKFRILSDEYFDKLRSQTLIYTMFDGTDSAPTLSNAQRPQKAPARR